MGGMEARHMWDAGRKLPTQVADGRPTCFYQRHIREVRKKRGGTYASAEDLAVIANASCAWWGQ